MPVGVEARAQMVRDQGMCGDLSPDGQRICVLPPGHEEPHPWDVPVDAEAHAATIREALVRPYRNAKSGDSFFAIDEMPEFEALAALVQETQALRAALEDMQQRLDLADSTDLRLADAVLRDRTRRAVAAEADRDGLATALKYADQKIAAVEADRDRLQAAYVSAEKQVTELLAEAQTLRDALEQIWDREGDPIARAALATPDTPLPAHVERAIREVEKTATKEVREQTGRDDLEVKFDRRAAGATPDTPPDAPTEGGDDA
jgi:hypothetical protein